MSDDFTNRLEDRGIRISMDGRGRYLDNIFVERLWRSVKYEEVYLNDYHEVREAKNRLGQYFQFYNSERLHQSLGYHVPAEVYHEHQEGQKDIGKSEGLITILKPGHLDMLLGLHWRMEYLGIPKAGLILPGFKIE